MSAWFCGRCGSWFMCIGMMLVPCGCGRLDARAKLVGVLVAKVREASAVVPEPSGGTPRGGAA